MLTTKEEIARAILQRTIDNFDYYGWCQDYFAKDINNREVNYTSNRVARLCLAGGIERATYQLQMEKAYNPVKDNEEGKDLIYATIQRIIGQEEGYSISFFNDREGQTFPGIRNMLQEIMNSLPSDKKE